MFNVGPENDMRAKLVSESLVESVVTLAAAVLMTLAGAAMIEDTADAGGASVATRIVATHAPG